MSEDNPSILSHVSIGTDEFERAVAFYDRVLPTLGCRRVADHPGAVAYGKHYPEFWVQRPIDGRRPSATARTSGFSRPRGRRWMPFMRRHWPPAPRTMVRRDCDRSTGRPTTGVSCVTRTVTRSRPRSGIWRWPAPKTGRATDPGERLRNAHGLAPPAQERGRATGLASRMLLTRWQRSPANLGRWRILFSFRDEDAPARPWEARPRRAMAMSNHAGNGTIVVRGPATRTPEPRLVRYRPA